MPKFDVDALIAGFRTVYTDLLDQYKDDATAEFAEHAESLSVRAAKWAARAAGGDPEAEVELQLLKGIMMSVAAQVAFKQQQEFVEAAMNATRVVFRFLVGALLAA